MSTITKTLLNANRQFTDAQVQKIDGAFSEAVRTIRTLLKELPSVDVVLYDNPDYVVEQTGIGGNTDNANTVFIPLDSSFDFSQRELTFVIRHELHHTARMDKLGQTDSLFKKVISEGLADQFEKEFDRDFHPITYRTDIDKDIIRKGFKDLKKIIKTGEYNYYEWFFGYNAIYPNWFGYTIGNMIVETYCKEHNTLPSELTTTPADVFETTLDKLLASF